MPHSNPSDQSDFRASSSQELVTLTDEDGQNLVCYVEKKILLDQTDAEYLLLLPVHAAIEIFHWQSDEDTLADIEDDEVERLFPSARAVLAELDLTLKRSAYTLTAIGDIPEADEENCFALEVGDDGDTDNFQMLVQFYCDDERYVACTPLEPLLFFAQRTKDGVALLSPEEFEAMQPYLEDQLFEGLD